MIGKIAKFRINTFLLMLEIKINFSKLLQEVAQ